jgi:hypothetical protein
MITHDELEFARPDLEALLLEVLTSVFTEEAYTDDSPLPAGDRVTARLSILEEAEGFHLGVEIHTGGVLARLLAWRMFGADDPREPDLLDAVGELGNIAAGNVKSLLFHAARLSLPGARLDGAPAHAPPAGPAARIPADPAADPADGRTAPVTVGAAVLGQVVRLVLTPGADPDGLTWPPTTDDELLETQPRRSWSPTTARPCG